MSDPRMPAAEWLRAIMEWERGRRDRVGSLPAARAIAAELFVCADPDGGSCYPGLRHLERACGVSRSTVIAHRRRWLEHGWLVDTGRRAFGGSAIFHLRIPPEVVAAEIPPQEGDDAEVVAAEIPPSEKVVTQVVAAEPPPSPPEVVAGETPPPKGGDGGGDGGGSWPAPNLLPARVADSPEGARAGTDAHAREEPPRDSHPPPKPEGPERDRQRRRQERIPGIGDADPLPDEARLSRSKRAALNRHRAEAAALWERQEELRAEVRKAIGAQGRMLTPTAKRLARVAERLDDGNTPGDAEHVLQVYAREARRKSDMQWFNGETNWVEKNFDRALGILLPASREEQPAGHGGAQSALEAMTGHRWRSA